MKHLSIKPFTIILAVFVLLTVFAAPTQVRAGGSPIVSSVTSATADGAYKAGDTIQIEILFDQVVNVTGTPRLLLETGTTDQYVNYTSGSTTDTLTFDYVVQAGDASADLDYVATNSLDLNGGTIKDSADANDGTLVLPTPGDASSLRGSSAIVIDTAASTVTSFTVTTPSTSLNIPITAFTASDNTSVTGYLITTSATPPSAGDAGWALTAPTTYTVASNSSYTLYPWAKDAAGNISVVFGTPLTVMVDAAAPTVNTFTVTSPSASFYIPITAFTGSDNISVTGYLITTSAAKPASSAVGWSGTKPTYFTVASNGSYTLYPWVKDAVGNVSAAFGSPRAVIVDALKILFGTYTSLDLQSSIGEVPAMNNWLTSNGASGVTFAGDFMGITFNPAWNVPNELDAAWNAGFMPFVNLMPSDPWEGVYYDENCETAYDIAGGLCDAKLTVWAVEFKKWAGSTKQAYIAPMPEMNGDWTTYASDGPTFIQAFIRIRTIFNNAGVPRDAVRWVFAPNGWNNPTYSWKQFEYFYPGDAYTDIISFSAYNYGGCPTQYASWDKFDTSMKPYLDRMRVMAPSKPIFISQTGVLNVPVNAGDSSQTKSAWIEDTFSKLADYPAVRAIIYFNKINTYEVVGNCTAPDYRIYYGGSSGETGFLNIMKDSRFEKLDLNNSKWDDITTVYLGPSAIFNDVPVSYWANSYIERLYSAGITGGCVLSPLQYCPDNTVTRAQMAIFLEKGKNGSSFTPAAAGGNVFTDVPGTYWAAAWIEKLAQDGITGGCGSNIYCPDSTVTRAQMAIFLLKAKYGSNYSPPPAIGTFTDVPTTYWAAAWIEQLALEGITSGCGGSNYCPDNPVTRAQMAIFLVKAFNLP